MKLTTSESPREFIFTYKRRFIFGFSSKYRVKNKHEFVDSSHQNKQNFEGKKLSGLSEKEFIAFDECVWQIRYSWLGENCTHRFFWPVYRPCFIFPQPPWASAHLIPGFFKFLSPALGGLLRDNRGSVNRLRFLLFNFLTSIFAFIGLLSSRILQNNLLDLYLVVICRYKLSFVAKAK